MAANFRWGPDIFPLGQNPTFKKSGKMSDQKTFSHQKNIFFQVGKCPEPQTFSHFYLFFWKKWENVWSQRHFPTKKKYFFPCGKMSGTSDIFPLLYFFFEKVGKCLKSKTISHQNKIFFFQVGKCPDLQTFSHFYYIFWKKVGKCLQSNTFYQGQVPWCNFGVFSGILSIFLARKLTFSINLRQNWFLWAFFGIFNTLQVLQQSPTPIFMFLMCFLHYSRAKAQSAEFDQLTYHMHAISSRG